MLYYLFIQDYCSPGKGTFRVHVENRHCAAGGMTCTKGINVILEDKVQIKLMKEGTGYGEFYAAIGVGYGQPIQKNAIKFVLKQGVIIYFGKLRTLCLTHCFIEKLTQVWLLFYGMNASRNYTLQDLIFRRNKGIGHVGPCTRIANQQNSSYLELSPHWDIYRLHDRHWSQYILGPQVNCACSLRSQVQSKRILCMLS